MERRRHLSKPSLEKHLNCLSPVCVVAPFPPTLFLKCAMVLVGSASPETRLLKIVPPEPLPRLPGPDAGDRA